MDIQVSQRHIDQGKQHSYDDCAVARALREKGHRQVLVGLHDHYSPWGGNGRRLAKVDGELFVLSDQATEFVNRFDKAKELVAPTTLTLSPYFPNQSAVYEMMAYQMKHQVVKMPPMAAMVFDEGKMPDAPVTATETAWFLKDYSKPMYYHSKPVMGFDTGYTS